MTAAYYFLQSTVCTRVFLYVPAVYSPVHGHVCVCVCVSSHRQVGQGHEAHEVVPHAADVLQQLLKLLRAHRCCLDAQLHASGHAIHFHHTCREKTHTKKYFTKQTMQIFL